MDITTFLSLKPNEHNIVVSTECELSLNIETLLQSNDLDKLVALYQSIDEYSAFDFASAEIHLESWSTERIVSLPFPQWSSPEWENKIKQSTKLSFLEWDNFLPPDVQEKRIGYWKKYGTWETPIVLIQMSDFVDCSTSKLIQLFEGHNRLFRLKVLHKFKNMELQKRHLVFVISQKA